MCKFSMDCCLLIFKEMKWNELKCVSYIIVICFEWDYIGVRINGFSIFNKFLVDMCILLICFYLVFFCKLIF